MELIPSLIERLQRTEKGFTDIRKAADELAESHDLSQRMVLTTELFQSPVHQARMLAVFLYGDSAATRPESLRILKDSVSRDPDWRVQEILAQAFDRYCADTDYEAALPTIREWLADPHPNVRRAVSEGLRIWTSRPYFKQHPDVAIQLLSQLKADDSEYVRKSAGNALRDISRKHPDLVRAELDAWTLDDKRIASTYKSVYGKGIK
jgi:3-methyladenine DNA glycosylase AlkC